MSEAVALNIPTSVDLARMSAQNPVSFLKNLDELVDEYGQQQLTNAVTRHFCDSFATKLKAQIDSSDLPSVIKDMANDIIDSRLLMSRQQCPCSSEASEAVNNCNQSEQIDGAADEACRACCDGGSSTDVTSNVSSSDASSESSDGCSSASASESESCSGCTDASSGNDVDTSGMTQEEIDEATAEAINEGDATPTSDGGDTAADAAIGMQNADQERRKWANWLEVLAMNLADIQSKFLDKALDASSTMAAESDNVAPGGETGGDSKSAKFLEAQALFTANIQMFSLFANQSSTALKSIGEGLAGIARKQ